MDSKFKMEMTRHESLIKPIINPQAINIELLFRQITTLQQEREQWQSYCERLEQCNKSTNEINDTLLSRVTILEEELKKERAKSTKLQKELNGILRQQKGKVPMTLQRKSDPWRKSYRISRSSLNSSLESIERGLSIDELENVVKHTPSPSKIAFPESTKREPLKENSVKGIQTMSPNIKSIQLPSEDSCEGDEFTPTSSENNLFEEASANNQANSCQHEFGSVILEENREDTERLDCPAQKLLDDISKCIVANKYKPQIIENRGLLMTETGKEDVLPSSRRESRQPPQFFKAEVANFGNGLSEGTTHVPLIIPIFTPRDVTKPEGTKGKVKKRKFTAVEENKEDNEEMYLKTDRICSLLDGRSVAEEMPRIYEEFFIVGPDINSTTIKENSLHPVNLFHYPNLPINADCEKRRSVKEFCFPEGVKVFSSNSVKVPQTVPFVFTLNGIDENLPRHRTQPGWLYCICLKTVVTLQTDNEGEKVQTERVYVFMTYYPYFELFYKVLATIADKPSEDILALLHKLYNIKVEPEKPIVFDLGIGKSIPYAYSIPPQYEIAGYFCTALFAALPLDTLYTLLCCVLLERSVIFQSQNLNVLTSSILALCGLLSPFKWEHVLIPVVPNYLFDILEAPVPYLVGVNKDSTYSIKGQFPIAHSVIIVDLDTGTTFIDATKAGTESFPSLKYIFTEFADSYPNTKPELAKELCRKVRCTLKKSIMNNLPPLPLSKKEATGLETIKNLLKKSATEADQAFISKFVETQMFATYIEDRYLTPPRRNPYL